MFAILTRQLFLFHDPIELIDVSECLRSSLLIGKATFAGRVPEEGDPLVLRAKLQFRGVHEVSTNSGVKTLLMEDNNPRSTILNTERPYHQTPRISKTYLNDSCVGRIQACQLMNPPEQFLMSYAIRHSNTIGSASVVASRASYDGLDRISISNGIVHGLEQQASAAFATTKSRSFRVVRVTPAIV